MRFISTRDPHAAGVSFEEAVLRGLPPDNGLYLPATLGRLPAGWCDRLAGRSFTDLADDVVQALIGDALPPDARHAILARALTFDAPLRLIAPDTAVLELFHGPTLAFKDFGARFLAACLGWLAQRRAQPLTVLVATSGDTGGAVAAAFFNVPGVRVVILYPAGKVSVLQEKQIAARGGNIVALAVAGCFDDCQALVKQAFLDAPLNARCGLTSANSINLARLIPQTFYYFRAWQQLPEPHQPVAFAVPSGNFGNLTAGLLAQRIGLPAARLLAATNCNDTVPRFLDGGNYDPRPSRATLSNAMDVGNPSNFARLQHLCGKDATTLRAAIDGAAFSDAETAVALREVLESTGYLLDPHAAVAWLAWDRWRRRHPGHFGVILGTAHPAKFADVLAPLIGRPVPLPEALARLADLPTQARPTPASFAALREVLLEAGAA